MKIATGIGTFPDVWEVEKVFSIAKEIGYDGVELPLRSEGVLTYHSTEKDYIKIKQAADNCGIQICSIACSDFFGTPLTSHDENIRNKAKDMLKKELEAGSALSCDTVLVIPGMVDENTDYETAMERCEEWLAEFKPVAESYRVCMGLENVWNKFLQSPLEMRDLIDTQNSEFVGAYFDVGNVVVNGFPEQWIKTLGSRIKKVHFKDFSRRIGNMTGFVPLLRGDVNYCKVMEALQSVGYDGWVTAETGFAPEAPEATLSYTYMAMKKILEMKN